MSKVGQITAAVLERAGASRRFIVAIAGLRMFERKGRRRLSEPATAVPSQEAAMALEA